MCTRGFILKKSICKFALFRPALFRPDPYTRLTTNLKNSTKEYVFSIIVLCRGELNYRYKRHGYLRISLKEQIILLNFLRSMSNVL